jgi:hypothetical protein
MVEHMFDSKDVGIGLWPGESHDEDWWDANELYQLTGLEMADDWTEPDQHFLPAGLEDIVPGPFLAAIVSVVDPARLNGHDAVRLMMARARLASHEEAGKLEAMAEVAYATPSDPDSGVERSSEEVEYAAVEVSTALTMTRRASEDQLSRAVSLSGRLRRVWQALSAGVLDVARVRVFDQALGHLPDETVDQVLDRVLDDAGGLTTGQLRARLSRLALEADPDGSKASFEEGLADRRVTATANPDHTANINIYSARPEDAVAARAHIESVARGLKTKDEPRTLDQLRNDVAMDLLKGQCGCANPKHASAGGGRVNITVSAETLAGLSDQPGDLNGHGPVFAEIARKTVMENIDGEWVFTVTDNGKPVATGTLARRPTASQQRQVRAAYPKCVMVGCRDDAWNCDLDHRRPAACGGPTHNDNLGPLCRHHHMTRHHGHWELERLPNGDHKWTSPLGHTYIHKRGPPD